MMIRAEDQPGRLSRRAFLGVVGAAATLTACRGGGREAAATPSETSAPSSLGTASASEATGGLEAWDPSIRAGTAPDLPARIGKSLPNSAEFWQRTQFGMEVAAEDFGIEFLAADSRGDAARHVEQMEGFLQRGIGSLVITPIDMTSQTPVAERAIDDGVCVIGNVFVPAHCHDVASQYDVGYRLGEAAGQYISSELGGEAKVLNFNEDNIEALIPRYEGTRDGLKKTAPGADIVIDVQPEEITQESAFQTASTALQSEPEIKVVLGLDTWVLGALSAFEAAGKANDQLYFGGVDGETQALAAIKSGGPYKISFAWPMEVLSYAWVKFAADWLDGKSIPQVIDLGVAGLDSARAIDDFEAQMRDPRKHWDSYAELGFLGNISFDTRDNFRADLYDI